MKYFSVKSLILLLLFNFIVSINVNANQSEKEKIKIKYGIFIKKIVPNFKESTFWAEFYWWMKFENDSSKTHWTNKDILNIQYINATGVNPSGVEKEIQEVKKFGEHSYYYVGLHQGGFYFNSDYKKYPFDVQNLPILIDNATIPIEDLEFEVDTGSFNKSLQSKKFRALSNDVFNTKSVNYHITQTDINVINGTYNTDFGDPDFPAVSHFSRYNINIEITRLFIPFISKLIIPLIFIMSITYLVFFLEADKVDSSRGLSVTSMFSAIAFQIAISRDLPEIGYMIYVDKVFYVCYFLIATTMLISLIRYNIDKSEKQNKVLLVKRLNLFSRILYPIIFIGGLYLLA